MPEITARQAVMYMASLENDVVKRSRGCTLLHRVCTVEADNTGVFHKSALKIQCKPPNGSGIWHIVEIRLYLVPGRDKPDHLLWADCDCGYHTYVSETALALKWFASSIQSSNGQYPRLTNPNLRPKICKHILFGIKYAIQYVPVVAEGWNSKEFAMLQRNSRLRRAFLEFYDLKDKLKDRPGISRNPQTGKIVREFRGKRVPPHIQHLVRNLRTESSDPT